jgi:hypothetical protein
LDASDVTSAPTSPPIPFVDGTYYFGETYYLYPDPTPVPKKSCGNGTVGDGICPDPDLTCFEDGYCRKKKWWDAHHIEEKENALEPKRRLEYVQYKIER